MVEYWLFRHEKSRDNRDNVLSGRLNPPLCDEGRDRSLQLGRRAGLAIDAGTLKLPTKGAIYSSDLARASGTGEIVTGYLGLPRPLELTMLRERDLGELSGLTSGEARALVADRHKIIANTGVVYVEGHYAMESFASIEKRGKQFTEYVVRRIGNEGVAWTILHGDVGLGVVSAITGQPVRELIHELYLRNGDVVRVDETGYELVELPEAA